MAATKYQLIMGNVRETNETLEKLAAEGWVPILMSSTVNSSDRTSQVKVVILLGKTSG
jgi:hypothetical protein